MSMRQHPSYQSRLRRAAPAAADQQLAPEPVAVYTPVARYSRRACCCAARPAVIAVLPASASRPGATDLLLCGHHYRALLPALAAQGVTVLDTGGHPLTAGAWPDSA
ncbi:MAG: hypothetical protein WBH47_21605 [Streptosporangiaceae bacterium]